MKVYLCDHVDDNGRYATRPRGCCGDCKDGEHCWACPDFAFRCPPGCKCCAQHDGECEYHPGGSCCDCCTDCRSIGPF